jgi:hypothetical protein
MYVTTNKHAHPNTQEPQVYPPHDYLFTHCDQPVSIARALVTTQ